MSGFGASWVIPTRRHIRTMRSIFTGTGIDRVTWPRLQETEAIHLEEKRLKARRQLRQQRRIGATRLKRK
ncbi:MAG: hypothetical protein Q8O07_09960 [Chloroflexota bacterium]|nr:hypothetical protein [Chloroflexota bacterium]